LYRRNLIAEDQWSAPARSLGRHIALGLVRLGESVAMLCRRIAILVLVLHGVRVGPALDQAQLEVIRNAGEDVLGRVRRPQDAL